jgi:chorismate-pyruvate lyase
MDIGDNELLDHLVGLFHGNAAELGSFTPVPAAHVPQPYRQLLDHHHHMTVTVEAFHDSPVNLRILQQRRQGPLYCREILLTKQTDGLVVQYGAMSINLRYLDEEVQQDILSGQIPLGRTLIAHNVLREVQLLQLWRVVYGPALALYFGQPTGTETFGRTARIYCNGEPAVKLLEIVRACDAR